MAFGRTLGIAHKYINEHYDELDSGDVVDVRFILGETEKPEPSTRELILSDRGDTK